MHLSGEAELKVAALLSTWRAAAIDMMSLRGLNVRLFGDPRSLVSASHTERFDAIVLEDRLGEIHPWLAVLRSGVPATTSIIVVGVGGTQSIAQALLHGADDYATHGDGVDGLIHRLLAKSRLAEDRHPRHIRAGPFELDVARRALSSPFATVMLTPRECLFAQTLFASEAQAVPIGRLRVDLLGHRDSTGKRSIEQHIYNLRKKLATVSRDGVATLRIEAVHAVGFRLVATG